jgi:hypothetical protein
MPHETHWDLTSMHESERVTPPKLRCLPRTRKSRTGRTALLIDRVIPSRRGAPVSFHIRPLKTPEDCALAYADLLDDAGAGRLTPEEAQTISAIVAKRAELFASVELAAEIEALKVQLAALGSAPRLPPPIRRPFAIT